MPTRRKKETKEDFDKREREWHRKIDALILEIEPIHETIYRGHYNLPPKNDVMEMTDIEVYADNRRWRYTHGELDENGEPIQEEEEEDNSMDWIEDDDDSWLPDGPEFKMDQKALSHMIESGHLMADEATKKRMMAEAADAELRDLLSRSEPEY